MTKRVLSRVSMSALGAVALLAGSAVIAKDYPMVGGAAMYPTKTIVENAVNSKDHTTLVAAVKAAGLVDTLSGPGPFTVFAPTNDAFAKLPAGTVEKLTTDDKETLKSILTYHVVPGTIDAATLTNAITQAGDEGYSITTVQGATLNAKVVDGGVVLTDAAGNTAKVTATDVAASNGVIHVIDTVLMPK